jgi:hypothetical protein
MRPKELKDRIGDYWAKSSKEVQRAKGIVYKGAEVFGWRMGWVDGKGIGISPTITGENMTG